MAKSSRTQMRLAQITGSLGTGAGHIRPDVAAGTLAAQAHLDLSGSLSAMLSQISRIHGRTGNDSLNVAAGTFYTAVIPDSDGGQNLGAAGTEWAQLHVNRIDSAAALDVNVTAGLTLDATAMSIDGTDDSNITVTASGKDLDIAVAGGSTQELRLTSAGTGASAMHLAASAGGINIDAADMIDIDAADEITIDTTSADGHIAITSAHTAGDAIVISANAHAGSILDIDAGVLDVDVQAGVTIDAGAEVSLQAAAASDFTTSGGAITIDGKIGVNIKEDGTDVLVITTDRDVTLGASGRTVTINSNLDVNGTTTTIDTTNTQIEDRIIGLGVSGSNGNYSSLDTGLIFGFGEKSSAQAAVRYAGASNTFELARYIAAPASSSFGAASAYSDLKVANLFASDLELAGKLEIPDTNASHHLELKWNEDDTSDRVLNIDVNAADRTIDLTGNLTVEAASVVNQDLSTDSTAVTFAGLDLSDGNVTNVGIIDADEIQAADAGAGLTIDFSASNTGLSKILMPDNMASGLSIAEGSNSYIEFVTTDNQEAIAFSKFVSIADDIPVAFGAGAGDFQLKYDEASSDKLVLSASINGGVKAFLLGDGHSIDLQFGDANSSIERPAAGDLRVKGSTSVGVVAPFLQIDNGATNSGNIRLLEDGSNGTNYSEFRAAAVLGANTLFELPANNGSASQVLITNGSGVTSWADAGNAAKSIVSGSATAVAAAGTDLSTVSGLGAFDLALHSSISDATLGKSMAVFVNGQLLMSGSEAERAAGGVDYATSKSGNNFRLKLAFDLEVDDVIQTVIR